MKNSPETVKSLQTSDQSTPPTQTATATEEQTPPFPPVDRIFSKIVRADQATGRKVA